MSNPPIHVNPTIQSTRAADFRSFYTNGFTFAFSPVDFTMTFLSPQTTSPGVTLAGVNVASLKEEASVQMTLSTLKVLSEHLRVMVETYERELGPIKIQKRQRPNELNVEGLTQVLRNNPLTE